MSNISTGIVVDVPEASVASETEVEKGTEVTLSCATEGAQIYYTLDSSSPYYSDTRSLFDGTPIVIDEETTLKAAAIVESDIVSDVATFHYTVRNGTVTDIVVINGNDIRVIPVRVHDAFVVAGAEGTFSVNVYSMTGKLLMRQEQVMSGQKINATTLPAGIYLVQINGNDAYSTQRIVKD